MSTDQNVIYCNNITTLVWFSLTKPQGKMCVKLNMDNKNAFDAVQDTGRMMHRRNRCCEHLCVLQYVGQYLLRMIIFTPHLMCRVSAACLYCLIFSTPSIMWQLSCTGRVGGVDGMGYLIQLEEGYDSCQSWRLTRRNLQWIQ